MGTYTPSHYEFMVDFRPGEFSSSLRSLKAFKAGEVMAYLKGITKSAKDYSTVQCGPAPGDNILLNSDLAYINHSCEPNAAFDLSSSDRSKWHLRALKDISTDEYVTFFYPSTEWDMNQPFKCNCGKPTCLGKIQGAKYLTKSTLVARGYVSPWILQLVDKRDANLRCVLQ